MAQTCTEPFPAETHKTTEIECANMLQRIQLQAFAINKTTWHNLTKQTETAEAASQLSRLLCGLLVGSNGCPARSGLCYAVTQPPASTLAHLVLLSYAGSPWARWPQGSRVRDVLSRPLFNPHLLHTRPTVCRTFPGPILWWVPFG